jgi:hypothetical protein
MKTTILIITMQLIAVMNIFIVYFGLYELRSYLSLVNTMMLVTYSTIVLSIVLIFIKGQINERQRKASPSN